jgi:hypothetical protein
MNGEFHFLRTMQGVTSFAKVSVVMLRAIGYCVIDVEIATYSC